LRNKKPTKNGLLGVFSEGVVAFCAAEELRGCFVAASGLHLPDVHKHVPTFWALHPHGGHCFNVVFFADNRDLLLQGVFDDFSARFSLSGLFLAGLNVAAFWAS
jgi:hypothetical protein